MRTKSNGTRSVISRMVRVSVVFVSVGGGGIAEVEVLVANLIGGLPVNFRTFKVNKQKKDKTIRKQNNLPGALLTALCALQWYSHNRIKQ
jgi:hypothetical protein